MMFQKYKQNWKFTVPGSALVFLGGFVISRGLPSNMGLQLLGLVMLAAGTILTWYGMKREAPTSREDKQAAPGGAVSLPPNSLCIYPEHFDFEHIENPPGLPWDLSTGKACHVLEKVGDYWVEFRLPDNSEEDRYFPPSEYANAATMPATKKYLEWQPSLFQKIAFFACGVIIVIEAIVLVVLND